jgi:rhodanese-related sulfurtransferase
MVLMNSDTTIIDVRTPAEFAEGHLEGAINIDWQSATFVDEMAQFDPSGAYILYCRSGNRSSQAIDALAGRGYTNLSNGGGVDEASSLTGLAIVS